MTVVASGGWLWQYLRSPAAACGALRAAPRQRGSLPRPASLTRCPNQQAVHAEQAGAIAVIIANDSNEYFIMTDDGTRRQVRLHSFLISKADGDRLKASLPCNSGQATSCDANAAGNLKVAFGLGFQTRAQYKLT